MAHNKSFMTSNEQCALLPNCSNSSLISTRMWPFVDGLTNQYVFIMAYLYSIGRANIKGFNDELSRQIILIGEIIAQDICADTLMTRAKAFDNIIEVVCCLMKDNDFVAYVDINEQIWHEAISTKHSVLHRFNAPRIEADWSHCFPWNGNYEKSLHPEDAMTILYWLATRARPHCIRAIVKASVTAYLSFSKRGFATDNVIKKAKSLVFKDLHFEIDINGNEINAIYERYGSLINDQNAAAIFGKFDRMLPAHATNCRLYLKQTSLTGMTCLSTISKALQMAPDFPWAIVEAIIPGELCSAGEALLKVNGNQYYGYKPTLGKVAARNYQNLAYACKEILVTVFFHAHLNKYQGWTVAPQVKSFLDMLVCKYKYDVLSFNMAAPYF